MVARIKLNSDETESSHLRVVKKCAKSSAVARVAALLVILFIVLLSSLIYYGIVLERIDIFNQIVALNVKHDRAQSTESIMKLRTNIKLLTGDEAKKSAAADNADSDLIQYDSDDPSILASHGRLQYFHHRNRRQLMDEAQLDPLFIQGAPDFKGLYANVRSKRTKIALSKLEKEYNRCKKEAMNGNDCMLAFVKMYKIAKDISEKMEKMKEIFQDSELVLQRSSSSKSIESLELQKTVSTTTINEMPIEANSEEDVTVLDDNEGATETMESLEESTVSTPTTATTTITTTINTTTAEPITIPTTEFRPTRPRPVKISWIIDGNSDTGEELETSAENMVIEPEESTVTTVITTTTTENVETESTTDDIFLLSSSATDATNEMGTNETDSVENVNATTTREFVNDTTIENDTTTTIDIEINTTKINNDTTTIENDTTTTIDIETTTITMEEVTSDELTNSDSTTRTAPTTFLMDTSTVPMELTNQETDAEDEQEKSRKLKFDWIIDGNDSTNEATDSINVSNETARTDSDETTTMREIPTKPKPVRISWIIDGDAISGEHMESTTDPSSFTIKALQQQKSLISSESDEDDVLDRVTLLTSPPELHRTFTVSLSPGVTVSYGCGATSENHNCTETVTPSTSRERDSEQILREEGTHPLDNPTSLENMLIESHEADGFSQNKEEDDPNNATKAGSPYSAKEWEKKFKETAAQLTPHSELIDTFGDSDVKNMSKFAPEFNANNFGGGGGGNNPPFMSICEQMAKGIRNKGGKLGTIPDNNDSESFTQSPNVQFTSRGPGGFPVTGETMKASAQFMFNPSFGMPTVPICFYVTPASFRMLNQAPFWTPTYFGMPGGFGGSGSFMGGGMGGGPGGVFFVPQSFGGTGNFFGHSSGTGGGGVQGNLQSIFSKNASPMKQQNMNQQQHSKNQQQQQQEQQQQFFCTYMPNQVNGGNQGLGSSVNNLGFSNANFKLRTSNQTISTDIIYASYSGLPDHLGHRDHFKCELPDQIGCYGGNECILESAWCDGAVDCSDGSDEATCTCRDRLTENRICDGYADCPMGEDEIGCFGCENYMISCYDNAEEYERFNRSVVSMCYSSMEKCDGFKNCLNGKDERECSIIVNDVSHHMSHSVSNTEGFLYHNHRGQWYPVCNNAEKWAKEACEAEGVLTAPPNVTHRELKLPGPFVEPSLVGNVHFPPSCQKRDGQNELVDHASYVKCASAKCGTKLKQTFNKEAFLRSRSLRATKSMPQTTAEDANERIVGGTQSKPLKWPFVVALYRNGNFHCGGTIYSEHWIISAAHCVLNYQKYYYEVRAGVLRRSSYSLTTQTRSVSHIIVHQFYERRTMRNDLSLLRLSEPLQFNRWVRPICLPDMGRSTMGEDWIWGPEEDTVCTAVGWGAVLEKGPSSDQLREVVVPVRKLCTEREDQESESICAGDANGGRDACQGDSGGPLFCRSLSNDDEWYLAGVVSHGNGCARRGEYGVYTRVALFLDWIEMATRPDLLPQNQPKQTCPGYVCVWGGKRCIAQRRRCNRIVDCLGGEDEVGCIYNFIPDVGTAQNVTSTTETDYYPDNVDATTAEADVLLGSALSLDHIDESMISTDAPIQPTTTTKNIGTTSDQLSAASTIILSSVAMPETTEEPFSVTNLTITQTQTETETESNSTAMIENKVEMGQEMTTDDPGVIVSATMSWPVGWSTTATADFGEFKPDPDPSVTPEPHTVVHKRKNATDINGAPKSTPTPTSTPTSLSTTTLSSTSTTSPKNAPRKFICRIIPQIIEVANRCDRFADCEDGTDEEDCNCRDYLKGSLEILICDGKTDCEDLTDEQDCNLCTSDEFLCSSTKSCIPLEKRCDDVADCKNNEDERDCYALTNGKQVFWDANKQPNFSNLGILTRNNRGIWRPVCAHQAPFHKMDMATASEYCALIGLTGAKFFNVTELPHSHLVPIDPEIAKQPRLRSHLSAGLKDNPEFASVEQIFPSLPVASGARIELADETPETCSGIYLECDIKSNRTLPLKTISPGNPVMPSTLESQAMKPVLKTYDKPNVFVVPEVPPMIVKKKEAILDKLNAVIESKRNATMMVDQKLHEAIEELHWPWLVDIYANGRLWCVGALMEQHWVLVHETCYFGLRLNTDYVTALLGGGKNKDNHHKSFTEQIRRIDCIQVVPNSDIMLFHLERPVQLTHYVLPTFVPNFVPSKHECIAVLHDNQFGRTKAVQIKQHKDDRLCRNSAVTCYRLIAKKPSLDLMLQAAVSEEDMASISGEVELKTNGNQTEPQFLSQFTTCTQFGLRNASGGVDPIDQGILACRNFDSGWYPSALFAYNNTDCSSFHDSFGIRTLEKLYPTIQRIIDNATCPMTVDAPNCTAFRCPLGACLNDAQICDGTADCHDDSDEDINMCITIKKSCKNSEIKCRKSGKCIPKTKFCDHVPDCEDWTDEPTVCSCFTYLKATDPGKICDGVRNCWDKSDESPALCNCTAEHFPCGTNTDECVPRDFVCDKQVDCPNGEDERYCFGIEQPIKHAASGSSDNSKPNLLHPPKYGQVIEQSYGVWHTKCFPRSSPPDIYEVRQICKKLGYNFYRQPSYRLIDDAANEVVETNETPDMKGRSFGDAPIANKYRKATKTVVVSKFSPLRLNNELTLYLKPSRPIAELVHWNATDSSHCYRLEIRCA